MPFDTYRLSQISKKLVQRATPYIREGGAEKALLVVGDSTGVGVGAVRPEDSVAGRLAVHMQASRVENYSVSGARAKDLKGQIKNAKLPHYSIILVQIGANDILHFQSAKKTAALLRDALHTLPKADAVYLMSAGNIGAAPLLPSLLRAYYSWETPSYHHEFTLLARSLGITYINLYVPPERDPFILDALHYFAPDKFHPNSEGYRLWFEQLQKYLK